MLRLKCFNNGSSLLAILWGTYVRVLGSHPPPPPCSERIGGGGLKKKQKYEIRYSVMLKPKATQEVFAVRRSRWAPRAMYCLMVLKTERYVGGVVARRRVEGGGRY